MKMELSNYIDNLVHFVTKNSLIGLLLGARTLSLDYLKNLNKAYLNYLPYSVSIVAFSGKIQVKAVELVKDKKQNKSIRRQK